MEAMQTRILDSLERALRLRELEPVQSKDYSNRGTIYGMDEDYNTEVMIAFDFQHGSARFTVDGDGQSTRTFRVDYYDGAKIRELIGCVRGTA